MSYRIQLKQLRAQEQALAARQDQASRPASAKLGRLGDSSNQVFAMSSDGSKLPCFDYSSSLKFEGKSILLKGAQVVTKVGRA